MKNFTIPIPTMETSPPARKISRSHLDSLFNALVLIINLESPNETGNDLIAILSSCHNQLISQLDIDANATIKLYKSLASFLFSFIRGRRQSATMFKPQDWSLSHNCPTILIELIPFIAKHCLGEQWGTQTSKLFLQVSYALFQGHRVIVTPMKVDTSTITEPGKKIPTFENISKALERLGITGSKFQEVYKSKCSNAKLRIITTAGPNGQATWTAFEDAVAIVNSPSLLQAFKSFAEASNLSWILHSMVTTIEAPKTLKQMDPNAAPITGRIHAIEEWGGKTRLVAIVDYWTQALLTPLHDTVAHFLKALEQDGTFNQDKIINKVMKGTTEEKLEMFSFDLTAATDRLPIDFQVQVLKALFGAESNVPGLWKSVISSEREFQAPDGSMVKYAVGQPMGAKSSFPMLGLAHHVITQMAAINAGEKSYSKYVILGDDNTMSGSNVASNYQIIMEKLGVPINLDKSVLYSATLRSSGEICKRVFVEGVELTAIPAKLIVKAVKSGHLITDLQTVVCKRGWPITRANFLSFAIGLVDKRSVSGLILLNKLPTSVTGLTETIEIPHEITISKHFSETLTIEDTHFENAYTYALVTEQLKRVDGLLRGTLVMAETIATMANPDPAKVWPTALLENMKEEERKAAIASLPTLSWTHPMVLASQNELDRVLSHLSGLRSGTKALQVKAREGLLDILRNSLSEIWMGEGRSESQARRSILNAAISAMTKICSVDPEKVDPRAIYYSVLLSYAQRMWNVSWVWETGVHINAVKSKVNINTTLIEKRYKELIGEFNPTKIRL